MLNLVNASQLELINSKIKIVISNNKNSSGIDKAKEKNIKTKIANQKIMGQKDFENALTNTLKSKRRSCLFSRFHEYTSKILKRIGTEK